MSDTGHHPADDDELLARFVLGRAREAERRDVEAHLAVCERCRAAVADQRLLAAAAKRLGRDQLKSRLRHRLAQERPAAWPRLAMAASLLVAIGAGLLYLLLPAGSPEPLVADRLTIPDSHGTSAGSGSPAKNRRQKADLPPGPERVSGDVRASRLAAPTPTAPSSGQPPSVLEKVGAGGNTANPTVGQLHLEERSDERGGGFWSEGSVASSPDDEGLEGDADGFLDRKGKKESEQKASRKDRTAQLQAGQAAAQTLQVTQRPVSELPTLQQRTYRQGQSVPAYIQQEPAGTRITLYLDTLLSPEELAGARTEYRGADSLVVHLQRRSITYPLQGLQRRQGR